MNLRIVVEGQSLRWYGAPPRIADDSIQFVRLQFDFPTEWLSLRVTAQFTQSSTFNVDLKRGMCFLPAELVPGLCKLSLFGYGPGEAIRATTVPMEFKIEESGFTNGGEPPVPPTPDLYSQLLAELKTSEESVEANAKQVEENLRTTELHASNAKTSEENAATSEQNADQYAKEAKTSETNAKTSEEAAAQSAMEAAQHDTNLDLAVLDARSAAQAAHNSSLDAMNAASSANSAATVAGEHSNSANLSMLNARNAEKHTADAKEAAEEAARQAKTAQEAAKQSAKDSAGSAGSALAHEGNARNAQEQAFAAAQRAELAALNTANNMDYFARLEESARESRASAEFSKNLASESAEKAKTSENNAKASEQNAAKSAQEAKDAAANAKGVDVIAQPGQLIRVKEVDEEGKPAEWEPVPWGYTEQGMAEIFPETDMIEFTDPTFGKAWGIQKAPTLTAGKTYTVIYNGVPYDCVCRPGEDTGVSIANGAFALGNFAAVGGENTGEPFAMLVFPSIPQIAIIDLSGATSVRIVIMGKEEVAHKVPIEFLPDGVPFCSEDGTKIRKIDPRCMPDNTVDVFCVRFNTEYVDNAWKLTTTTTFEEIYEKVKNEKVIAIAIADFSGIENIFQLSVVNENGVGFSHVDINTGPVKISYISVRRTGEIVYRQTSL